MENNNSADTKNTLYAIGGLAMIVFGAGLIMTHPSVQKYLGQVGVGDLVEAAVPDVERYLKIRSM